MCVLFVLFWWREQYSFRDVILSVERLAREVCLKFYIERLIWDFLGLMY